jgi:hypothetical protein
MVLTAPTLKNPDFPLYSFRRFFIVYNLFDSPHSNNKGIELFLNEKMDRKARLVKVS